MHSLYKGNKHATRALLSFLGLLISPLVWVTLKMWFLIWRDWVDEMLTMYSYADVL